MYLEISKKAIVISNVPSVASNGPCARCVSLLILLYIEICLKRCPLL